MAKKEKQEERVIYCSGPNWEGDGSKSSSTCRFGDSMKTTAALYKCSRCTLRRSVPPPIVPTQETKGGDPIPEPVKTNKVTRKSKIRKKGF